VMSLSDGDAAAEGAGDRDVVKEAVKGSPQ
jgi:hypothetical protein